MLITCPIFISLSALILNALPNPTYALDQPVLDSNDSNVFIFVQLTDLHISKFNRPERYEQLQKFCETHLPIIKPKVVLITGDITEAVEEGLPLKIVQQEEEWIIYEQVYKKCRNYSEFSHWLDLRGNHDNFNVESSDSPSNLFLTYGVQSHRNGSYLEIVEESENTKYAFLGVDGTTHIGPKGIFSFFGELDENKLNELKQYKSLAKQQKVNATFWFGHYPLSAMHPASSHGLDSLAADGIAYFTGHLHHMGELVPQMFYKHSSGLLELELGDWKKNRKYRIAVMDNGLFSFVDMIYGTWPAIVALNPKPALTVQPTKEPYELVLQSSHIRLLVFSPSKIDICEWRINSEEWRECRLSGTNKPLFTAPWDPLKYSHGLHVLEIRAKDERGHENTLKIEFAIDDARPSTLFLGNLILGYNGVSVGISLIIIVIVVLLAPLLITRIWFIVSLCKKIGRPVFAFPQNPLKNRNVIHEPGIMATDSVYIQRDVNSRLEFTFDNIGFWRKYLLLITYVARVAWLSIKGIVFVAVVFLIPSEWYPLRLRNKRAYDETNEKRIELLDGQQKIHRRLAGLTIVATCTPLFYALFLYNIYLFFGPLFAANLLDNRIGVVFLWKTIFLGTPVTTLPASTSYYITLFHLLSFNLPLLVISIRSASASEKHIRRRKFTRKFLKRLMRNWPMPLFLLAHGILYKCIFVSALGWLAYFVNLMYLLGVGTALWLWYRTTKLTEKDFQ